MKKTLLAVLTALVCSASVAFAQNEYQPIKRTFVSVYGGPSFSINENGASYFLYNRQNELVDWVQGGASLGYYLSNRYGMRFSLEYANNHSADNHDETWQKNLWAYTFKNYALFADVIINGGNVDTPKRFNWRPYVGIGGGYSFDVTNTDHPWNIVHTDPNIVFAMRYGIILEYTFNTGLGIFVDGCHEWYTDSFNGMNTKDDFPFDMKLNTNFGLVFHL